jgi:hypothetical protein
MVATAAEAIGMRLWPVHVGDELVPATDATERGAPNADSGPVHEPFRTPAIGRDGGTANLRTLRLIDLRAAQRGAAVHLEVTDGAEAGALIQVCAYGVDDLNAFVSTCEQELRSIITPEVADLG